MHPGGGATDTTMASGLWMRCPSATPSGVKESSWAVYHGSVDPRLLMLNPAGSGMRDARIPEKVSAGVIRSSRIEAERVDDRLGPARGELCDPSRVDRYRYVIR